MKKEKLTFTQLSPKTLFTHNIIFIYKDHGPTWGGKPRRESESMKYAYDPSVCRGGPEKSWGRLASQPRLHGEFQASERHCLNINDSCTCMYVLLLPPVHIPQIMSLNPCHLQKGVLNFPQRGHAEYLGYVCEDFSFLGSGDFHIAKQFIGGWLLTIFTRQKGPNHLWLCSCPFLPDGLLMSIDVI